MTFLERVEEDLQRRREAPAAQEAEGVDDGHHAVL